MGRLDDVDLSKSLSSEEELKQLPQLQRRLLALRLQMGGLRGEGRLGPPVAVLFEGWDAAGKGGTIRRLVAPLDPRHVRVEEFAAPDDRERRHHFLWRFVPALPGWGGMAVFDRTWYGRVLVERVDGFAERKEWHRAYDQIVAFEDMMAAEGTVFVKFFLHISSREQLRRLRARENDPLKRWKLTPDDWHNRSQRAKYVKAIDDMLERTSTDAAPWTVVPAESKRTTRAHVVETVIEAMAKGLRAIGANRSTTENQP